MRIATIGCIIAMYLSWITWQSVSWVIVHGFLGWFYVLYYFFKYGLPGE